MRGPFRQQEVGLLDDFLIICLAGILKQGDNLIISEPFHKAHFGNGAPPAAVHDLPKGPIQVLQGMLGIRHDVHRRFDGHRPHLLQSPPDLDPEGVGFGGKLVNQEKPLVMGLGYHLHVQFNCYVESVTGVTSCQCPNRKLGQLLIDC